MITFDCCPSADSESDSADLAAADIDKPESGSNSIEPDLAPEGEVEDSRAPVAIAPEHAPEGEFFEDDRLSRIRGQ